MISVGFPVVSSVLDAGVGDRVSQGDALIHVEASAVDEAET